MHGDILGLFFPRCVPTRKYCNAHRGKGQIICWRHDRESPQHNRRWTLSKIGSSKLKRFLVSRNCILFSCVCLDVYLENEVYRLYCWCKESHRRCKVCAHYQTVPLVRALNDEFWKFWRVSSSIFLPSCFEKSWCLCDYFFKYGG